MKDKSFLFTGIILLIIGILLSKTTNIQYIPSIIIFIGVAFKIFYITKLIRSKKYKPGYELVLLFLGLILFFLAKFIKAQDYSISHYYFLFSGIALKIGFIIVFMNKIRKT